LKLQIKEHTQNKRPTRKNFPSEPLVGLLGDDAARHLVRPGQGNDVEPLSRGERLVFGAAAGSRGRNAIGREAAEKAPEVVRVPEEERGPKLRPPDETRGGGG
jgi:hypothetical protein